MSTFHRWYDAFQRSGPEALADRPSRPSRVWNRLPAEVGEQIVALALEEPELSLRRHTVVRTLLRIVRGRRMR